MAKGNAGRLSGLRSVWRGIRLPRIGNVSITLARRGSRMQVIKLAVATVLSWIIAGALVRSSLPVFAAVAALLVVQPSVSQSLGRAVERSIGVIAGVIVAFIIEQIFGAGYWIVLIAIVVAILVAWLLRLTPTTAVQIPISAMLVLSVGATSADYSIDRIIDTVIGAAIGVAVNLLIVPPVALVPAQQALAELYEETAARIDAVARALSTRVSDAEIAELMLLVRLLRPMREKLLTMVAAAEESLAANPLGGRHQLSYDALTERLDLITALITRTLAMTRTVYDHYSTALVSEPIMESLADEAHRAAHDLRLLIPAIAEEESNSGSSGQHTGVTASDSHDDPGNAQESPGKASAEASPPTIADSIEAETMLTAPLVVVTPPAEWVVIGALVEDLRRIHETVTFATSEV